MGVLEQAKGKYGITPRNKDFNASSSFDIRRLNDKNIKAIGQYITKYIIKNKDEFDCQVWNCSKKISMFYPDFYSGFEFIDNVERVLETEIEPIPAEYCTVYPVPLNQRTLPMYERLSEQKRLVVKTHSKINFIVNTSYELLKSLSLNQKFIACINKIYSIFTLKVAP